MDKKKQTSPKPPHDPSHRTKSETSAGGIVFKRTLSGVRVALIMDPYHKWTFAKGKVEKGETLVQTAVRETKEEMGLRKVRPVMPLGKIAIWFRERYRPELKGVLIHKHVYYYLMEAPAGAWGKPQKKEKIHQIIWVPLSKLREKSSYADVRPIIDRMELYFKKRPQKARRNPRDRGVSSSVDDPTSSVLH